MVTDLTLSALTNLFALLGARDGVALDSSKALLANYLSRHFGIRNIDLFVDMYDELRAMYDDTDIDKESIVESVASGLLGKIDNKEREMLLLRLMQFCYHGQTESLRDDILFQKVAKSFDISQPLFVTFCDFVEEKDSEQVHRHELSGIDGYIITLWIAQNNLMLFTYKGNSEVTMDDVPVVPGMFITWSQSGVLKHSHSGIRLYYSNIFSTYACKNTDNNVEFCGRHIEFLFPNSNNGIHDFSFTIKNGELVAVMGGSGVGKSTLMSLLNGTLMPNSGTITINGHDITNPEAKKLIGYVPQDDLLIEELTVYQNLWYTAKLCFEGMSREEMHKRVITTLRELGLEQVKNLKVGSPLKKSISGGQRKRLNIALELIREPSILFLDEPTSGLSSSDTENVVNILKELTYKGKLVITNIHQPSSDVYKLFDRLWLLDKGGYPIFDGNPIEAITYFKNAANYADPDTSTCPLCGNVNPEIIFNIVEEKTLDEAGRVSGNRKMKPQMWHKSYIENAASSFTDEVKKTALPMTYQRRPSAIKQFCIYLERNFRSKITNLQYLLITVVGAPFLAMVCSLLTHYAKPEGYSVMDNKNLVSYLFMSVVVAIFVGMNGSAEEIIKDRLLLGREKFLSLSYGSYITSKIVFMACTVMIQTLLFVLVGNAMQGLLTWSMFPSWWGLLFVVAFLSGLTGLLLSQSLNSVVTIYISIPILLIPQILLCGLVVSFSDLTPRSTTGNVPLIGNIIPSRWAFEALAVTQFKDNNYESSLFDARQKKCETQYYLNAYLAEIQSQLETMEYERSNGKNVDENHILVIRNSLPLLSEIAEMTPYRGDYSYASLKHYTDDAEKLLRKKSNLLSLAEDAIVVYMQSQMGKENFLQLKRDNYNLQLEKVVMNADSYATHEVVDGHIVPRMGAIYLMPRSSNGNAPFYSPAKRIGNVIFPTYGYNVIVMLLMSIVVSIMLYSDCPGRWIRKHT